MNSKDNFKEYMEDQVDEINRYKWIKGEQIGHDPGVSAIKEWISKYSQVFRDNWDKTHKD